MINPPSWYFPTIAVAALIAAGSLAYQSFTSVQHEWYQLDQTGTGEWAQTKLVVPRVFDRRTAELCEYRGAGAKVDYNSQRLRGAWVCYPGPLSN